MAQLEQLMGLAATLSQPAVPAGALGSTLVAIDPTAQGALSFNAADPDRVSISNVANPGAGDFTLRCLIASYATSGSPDYRFLITKGAGGGLNGFRFGIISPAFRPYLLIGGTAHFIEQGIGTTSFPNDGAFHSLAVAVNRSTNIATAYIDGKNVGSVSVATVGAESVGSISALVIGSGGSVAVAYSGKLDEVAYWGACLTDAEMAALEGYKVNASDPRLYGLWRFDEGSGSVINDASAAGHNGVLVGATWVAGAALLAPSVVSGAPQEPATPVGSLSEPSTAAGGDYALNFDGATGQIVSIPASASLNNLATMSVEAWVRDDSPVGAWNGGIFEKSIGGAVNTQFLLFLESTNIVWRVKPASTIYRHVVVPWAIFKGLNTHVVGTYDGQVIRLYIRGALQATLDLGAPTPPAMGAGASQVGWLFPSATGYKFKGAIDGVRVYSRALSAAEIAARAAGKEIDTTGLVGWWRFNEGSGAVALDSSGSNNAGSLVSGPTYVAGIDPDFVAVAAGSISQPSSPVGALSQP